MKRTIRRKSETQREWERQFPYCFLCGVAAWASGANMNTHHIVRTGLNPKGNDEPANWLRVCNDLSYGCQSRIHGWPPEAIAVQLALKRLADPENYSRRRVLELHGYDNGFVAPMQMCRIVRRLRDAGFDAPTTTPERAITLVEKEVRHGTVRLPNI